MKFEMRYALGGRFAGCDKAEWEDCFSKAYDDAVTEAYQMACEKYDNYDGMHGLDSKESIKEENPDWCDDEVSEEYKECRESWLEYEVRAKQ